jgi:excisionase family DNA binding protein
MIRTETREEQEILTLAELAQFLKISEKSIVRMAQRSEIPFAKIGSQWRFKKTMIEDWLVSRMHLASPSTLTKLIESGEVTPSLSRLIPPSHIHQNLKPGSKKDILTQLVDLLVKEGKIADGTALLNLLWDREAMASTAIAKGIAVPHVRNIKLCPVTEPCIVLGRCKEGMDYDAIDGHKTYLFFLICTNSEIVHLKVMAKIMLLARNTEVIENLKKAGSVKEAESILIKACQV